MQNMFLNIQNDLFVSIKSCTFANVILNTIFLP